MLYDYLEEFAAIAREGSLSAAATATGLSQPALSRHLAALEAQLGAALVIRGSGGARLTPEGRYALDTALDIAALERSVELHFSESGHQTRIRHVRTVALDVFPAVERFVARACTELNAEGVRLELRRADEDFVSMAPKELLSRRYADMVVGFRGVLERDLGEEDRLVIPLVEIPGVAIFPPAHRLAHTAHIGLDDLRSFPIARKPAGRDEAAGGWDELCLACRKAGFTPLSKTRSHIGGWDTVYQDADEIEICLNDNPEIARRIAMGQLVVPVEGLAFVEAIALRADDGLARQLAERARDIAVHTEPPSPISHPSMYGAPGRDAPITATRAAVDRVRKVDELEPDAQARAFARILDEPKVAEDLVLPDGTVVDKAYVALRNRLNRIGDGLSNDPVETSYQLLMHLWDIDEARAELEMPLLEWFTAYDFAASSGRDLEACEELLGRMSRKNLLFRATRGGIDYYYVLGWVYGIWEFSVQHYADAGFAGAGIYGSDAGSTSHYPIMHACPVGKEVVRGGALAPYRDWKGYIARQSIACVAPCQCRRFREVECGQNAPTHASRVAGTEKQDDCPIEVCLTFGEMAEYWIENGNGRQIPVDEALRIAHEAVYDHGMVPQLYFSQNPEVACFCRSDDCLVLSTARATNGKADSFSAMSAYTLEYDADACIGCGACASRCPMGAIERDEEGRYPAAGPCVACGQCVLACPSKARILVAKDPCDVSRLPKDLLESYRWRSEDRMAHGYVSDFAAPRLDLWGGWPC